MLNTYWLFVLILLINSVCLVIYPEVWKETKTIFFVVTGYFKVPLENIGCNALIFFCITGFMVLVYNYLFMTLIYLYIWSRNAVNMSVYIFMVYSGILFLVSYIFICFYHSHFSSQIKTGVYFLILALSLWMYFFPKNCSIHLYSKSNSIFTNIISVHCYNYY